MPTVHLLDYVAGNVRSLANAIEKLGYQIEWIRDPKQIEDAEVRGPTKFSAPSCCCQNMMPSLLSIMLRQSSKATDVNSLIANRGLKEVSIVTVLMIRN